MKAYNVYIKPAEFYSEPIEYILKLISINQQTRFNFLNEKAAADLVFDDTDPENTLPIAVQFYEKILHDRLYNFTNHFKEDCIIRSLNGGKDYIATAFYMVNCFQEYSAGKESLDRFNRFLYEKSYQHHYNNIEENLVQGYFESFCKEYLPGHISIKTRSRIFVSHDIDTINGALLQDGYWALRHKRLDVIFKLIFNFLLFRPDWKNMDRIMQINDEYSLKSTFFWIANEVSSADGIKNADYNLKSLKPLLEKIEKNGYYNGLHKSYSELGLPEEINRFPLRVNYNRNHFIHFNLPDLWNSLENTGIKADFSLGFAQRHGFRNSYGFPYSPYNMDSKTNYSFIEVPLNVMDTTFHKYLKLPVNETADSIIGFIEKNAHNTILSLLWHNIYFTDFKYNGYLKEYKKVLGYIYEMKIKPVTPPEIVKEFTYGE